MRQRRALKADCQQGISLTEIVNAWLTLESSLSVCACLALTRRDVQPDQRPNHGQLSLCLSLARFVRPERPNRHFWPQLFWRLERTAASRGSSAIHWKSQSNLPATPPYGRLAAITSPYNRRI